MRQPLCLLFLVFCAGLLLARAGSGGSLLATGDSFGPPAAPSVTVVPPEPVKVAPGKLGKVELAFRVQPGFHINSNTPHDDLLKPTVLLFDPPTDVLVGKPSYPPGQQFTPRFLPNDTLNVYAGDFTVTALVSTARSITPGTYRVRAALHYQACDDRQCYSPKQLPVAFDVVVKKAVRHVRRNPGQSPHVHN